MKNLPRTMVFLIVCFVCSSQAFQAQTTAFTYQGQLNDSGAAANGLYDFTFTIYGSSVGGIPVSGDLTVGDVQVTNGIFTVNLDFGASPFNSPTDNHLEIAVRPGASVGVYTTLSPRQRLTSSPYSIKTLSAVSADSLSAACVSCVTDANIDSVGANKVTGVLSYFQGGTGIGGTFPAGVFLRSNGAGWQANGLLASDIPTNLGSYIQNTTTTQATSNFNVSGTGTANIFNAATQYNIGGNRVLSAAGTSNLFAGIGAGQSNAGVSNAFFGSGAGQTNTTASFNAFFGSGAGFANTGNENSFFGYTAGRNNSTGEGNSFFGKNSGNANTTGGSNSFLGFNAGRLNTLGNNNTFLGVAAGDTNTTGNRNTLIGSLADVATNNLIYATAIGAEAVVSSSNTVVLGRILDTVQIPGALNVTGATTFGGTLGASIFNATTQYNIGGSQVLSVLGVNNTFVGIQSGLSNTTGVSNSFFGRNSGVSNTTGFENTFAGISAGNLTTTGFENTFIGRGAGSSNTTGSNNTIVGESTNLGANNLSFATAIGSQAVVSASNTVVLGRNLDTVQIPGNLNVAGNFTGSFTVSAGSITGVLARFNGGTGLNSSGAAGNFLRSDGTNWTSSALQVSDIPNLNTSYIQNIPGIGQQTGSFNITGGGNANIFNSTNGYNIGGSLILSSPGVDNLFAGRLAGISTTSGVVNSFFGYRAGEGNVGGSSNSFFGERSGLNSEAVNNSFFGAVAGQTNVNGSNNTLIGTLTDVGAANLNFATAIGAGAVVSQSNSLVLGNNVNVGIGTSAPGYKLDVVGRSRFKQNSGSIGTAGSAGIWFFQNTPNDDRAFVGMENDNSVGLYGNNGGNWGLVMNTQTGVTSVRALGAAGSTSLCRNSNNEISTCSSSIRYKQNINPFNQGLSLIKQLRPVLFNWRANNQADLGLVAEEVASVEPLLTSVNEKGETEGVKYDRVGVVLINAVQEQQTQIEAQARQIEEHKALIGQQQEKADKQQTEINALKILVCSQNPTAEICKPARR